MEDGSLLPGAQGRLCTPGHALEAGWFLLQEANLRYVGRGIMIVVGVQYTVYTTCLPFTIGGI